MNSIKKIRDSEMEYFFSTLFARSEEHTSELQSQSNLVCRLLLEKKKKIRICLGIVDTLLRKVFVDDGLSRLMIVKLSIIVAVVCGCRYSVMHLCEHDDVVD